jgi:hypothetical protein
LETLPTHKALIWLLRLEDISMAESKSGFLYEPSTEDEVVLLFGLLMPHIGEFLKELGLGSRLFVE